VKCLKNEISCITILAILFAKSGHGPEHLILLFNFVFYINISKTEVFLCVYSYKNFNKCEDLCKLYHD